MTEHTAILASVAAYYAFNCFAGAMMAPLPGQERTAYGYAFRVVQSLAANSHRFIEARLPGLAAEIAAAEAKVFSRSSTHPDPPSSASKSV